MPTQEFFTNPYSPDEVLRSDPGFPSLYDSGDLNPGFDQETHLIVSANQ
jgi:hypothetical protein